MIPPNVTLNYYVISLWYPKKYVLGSIPSTYFGTYPVAQTVKNLSVMWETWVVSMSWKDPLENKRATHSSILAWKTQGQRSLVGY